MKIDKATVERLAQLAEVAIDENDSAELESRLSKIVKAIQLIDNINTEGIEPLCNPFDQTQRLRQDSVTEDNCRDYYQERASQVEKGLYLVPQVIE